MKKKLVKVLGLLLVMMLIVACQSESKEPKQEKSLSSNSTEKETETGDNPVVTITMENGGTITAELYPEIAPNTVNNFIALIEDGFYDELIFHRVIPGFMIQGGDPEGNGTGGPGYAIAGEFNANDFDNPLAHERGVLSMARSGDPDSAGSQFFVMTETSPHLDGDYAAFGKVTDGMDVVDEIVNTERDAMDKPLEDQVIQSMTVTLNGYKPEKVIKQ